MKRLFLCAVLALLVVAAGFAEQDESRFRIGASAQIVTSVRTVYAASGVSLVHRVHGFGIGIGSKAYYGLRYGGLFVSPHLRFELGPVYANGGALFEVLPPRERGELYPTSLSDAEMTSSPSVSLGIAPKIAGLGGGTVALDIAVEAFVSTIYIKDPGDDEEPTGWAARVPVLVAQSVPKLSVGLAYSFGM